MKISFLASILALAIVSPLFAEDGFVKLFNGKDLTGWKQLNGTAKYTVVDGTIQGVTAEGSPNSFLCSEKS